MNSHTTIDHSYNCIVTTTKNTFLLDSLTLYNKNLHYWKSWYCNAGVDCIYITASSDIYTAVCKNAKLGNIQDIINSNSTLSLPLSASQCTQNNCSACSTDLQLTKFDPDHCVNCD